MDTDGGGWKQTVRAALDESRQRPGRAHIRISIYSVGGPSSLPPPSPKPNDYLTPGVVDGIRIGAHKKQHRADIGYRRCDENLSKTCRLVDISTLRIPHPRQRLVPPGTFGTSNVPHHVSRYCLEFDREQLSWSDPPQGSSRSTVTVPCFHLSSLTRYFSTMHRMAT